jgi:NADH:ubiquinone oxidoreductase subunit 6 (subunit J)
MVDMIDALYTATNSPLVMAVVTAIFAATATLLAFMAVIRRQPLLSWMSIFIFTLASTAMFFSLVRTEPDRQTLIIYQVYIRYAYIAMGVMCIVFSGWLVAATGEEEKRIGETKKPQV